MILHYFKFVLAISPRVATRGRSAGGNWPMAWAIVYHNGPPHGWGRAGCGMGGKSER